MSRKLHAQMLIGIVLWAVAMAIAWVGVLQQRWRFLLVWILLETVLGGAGILVSFRHLKKLSLMFAFREGDQIEGYEVVRADRAGEEGPST